MTDREASSSSALRGAGSRGARDSGDQGSGNQGLPWLRWAVLALALALVLAATLRHLELRRSLTKELQQAAEWGLLAEDENLAPALRQAPSPARAQLRLARWLVADALERAANDQPPLPQRLLDAEALARRAGDNLPRSWEAPMLEGAAIYLHRAAERDPALFLSAQDWRSPLEEAVRRAPTRGEPARFLAAAYLEVWPALAEIDRERARELLRQALMDPHWQRILTVPWLERASSRSEALELLPPNPPAWREAMGHYAQQRDRRGIIAAHEGLRRAQRQEAESWMEEGLQRLEGGDLRRARSRLLAAAVAIPADGAHTSLVEEALQRAPAGPKVSAFAAGLQSHLNWAVERALLDQPTLPPAVISRLRFASGPLPPPQQTAALLAADQIVEAERGLRRAEGQARQAEWATAHLLYTRAQLARGDLQGAREAMAWVHGSARNEAVYWQLRQQLGLALADEADLALSARRLSTFGSSPRPGSSWQPIELDSSRRGWALTLWAAEPIDELRIEILQAPGRGSAAELWIDGAFFETHWVRPGRELRLRLDSPLEAQALHRITLLPLFGAPITPGQTRLGTADS
ncbi:MAG: hypothetical protein AAGD01_06535 [Acidobacteriota bacterium]